MGNYVTVEDVDGQIANVTFGPNSQPLRDTDIEVTIQAIEGQMNGHLSSLGFSVPISAPISLGILKSISIQGVLAMVYDALLGIQTKDESPRVARHWKLYLDWFTSLINSGGSTLTDADRASGAAAHSTAPVMTARDNIETAMGLPHLTELRHAQNDALLEQSGFPVRRSVLIP